MVAPGLITARALEEVRKAIRPGITTLELDQIAEKVIQDAGAESNFKLVRGYRHTVCASVNEQVVHGIPSDRVLVPGDIVSIDAGAQYEGWNGDSAITVVLEDPEQAELVAARNELSDVTKHSLWAGIAALATAKTLADVSAAIEDAVLESGKNFGILRDYVGHGIGRKMHEEPSLFNYRVEGKQAAVKPGLCLAIEPMVVAGSPETLIEDDGWTVSTRDGSSGSHWEHSVAVHDRGIWVLTAPDGGAEALAPFGVTPKEIGK